MPTRRGFLRIAGSSAVILAAGSGTFALTRTPAHALAPWAMAGDTGLYTDPRVRALSYAILAPNPHNQQPWLVDLNEPDTVTLYCDLERRLPETDPFDRQILIGLGCFLELARLAAAEDRRLVKLTPFPDDQPGERLDHRPIARLKFGPEGSADPDPLFTHVRERRSLKEPFDLDKPLAQETLLALQSVVPEALHSGFNLSAALRAELRTLSWQAHLVEVTTHRTNMESVNLMRIGKAEINANPDGIDIGGTALLDGLALVGLLNRAQLADPNSNGFQQGLDLYRALLMSAMGHFWIASDGNSRQSQLLSGAAWLRVNLKATSLGLGIHPLSQALQEYPEMSPLYQSLHKKLPDVTDRRVQMFARVGYGPQTRPSPRWPVETKVRPR
ncbi:MAG: twin-arginine translocation pathway signal protein [Alphaproteobacteria bacterium]|nr:twin-arginine translocation pathway signal protein [Alphaproteobacteria bacterium]MBO6628028.1 twin-arginine translocation pathway signal protein [Alphaproteobacteria bacterium]